MTEPEDKAGARGHIFTETIAAVITPPGEGGVAAIRIAGQAALVVLKEVFQTNAEQDNSPKPFLMRYGNYVAQSGATLDEVMAVFMPEGKSYTGLDQAEIFCHGGQQVVKLILSDLLARSVRAAEPGEFTKLAFLNGRIDLARAEAVAELIAANTESSYQTSRDHLLGRYTAHIKSLRKKLISIVADIEAALDFPEEDLDSSVLTSYAKAVSTIKTDIQVLLGSYQGGRIVREGYRVVLAGRPNAGKSSLFNLLLRKERALVHPEAGTTRDYLSEWVDIGGFAVNLVDTAGLRDNATEVEIAGQQRAQDAMQQADLTVWIVDVSEPDWSSSCDDDLRQLARQNHIVLGNKLDLVGSMAPAPVRENMLLISCKTTEGLTDLERALVERINVSMPNLTSGLVVTSARHQQKLSIGLESLVAAEEKLSSADQLELAVYDIRQTVAALEEITGRVYTEDILESIFSTFCIGK